MALDITKNNLSKYFIFGSLYITEGIHIAIAWVLTPLYLLHLDMSPEIVTLSSGVIMIPWIGKFIFGYYIDQWSHKGRKPFIIYGGLLSSITLLIVPIINPETFFIGFILLLILGQIGIGFLDLSADAWAINITKKRQRGKLSGAMTIGLYLGMFLGSAVIAFITGGIGAFFGGKSKVTELECAERRDSCGKLNQLRDDRLHEKVDMIDSKIDLLLNKD